MVDASVAVKWVVKENESDFALALLDPDNELQAPDFLLVETGSVLWKKVRRKEISSEQASSALAQIATCFDVLGAASTLVPRALEIAIAIDHPIYDCLYFAYAEREAAPLITSDRRAHDKASKQFASIRTLLLADGALTTHQ